VAVVVEGSHTDPTHAVVISHMTPDLASGASNIAIFRTLIETFLNKILLDAQLSPIAP